jgi:hypothetical protein
VGSWNIFVIEARSGDITVVLNGVLVSRLTGGSRRRSGYVGFQAHHAGSAVRFRNLQIKTI